MIGDPLDRHHHLKNITFHEIFFIQKIVERMVTQKRDILEKSTQWNYWIKNERFF